MGNFSINFFYDKVPLDLPDYESEIGFKSVHLPRVELWVLLDILSHTPLKSSLSFTLEIKSRSRVNNRIFW